ncbi:UDP-23-diacylglucosamine hydrolase [Dissostichus eleginoides]|uniref:UDP-23-diacylglucosamine hydrolase n=1 Tax=Dissostichus eleginoides TaxID=100907 RepID=A0AAD9CT76_DISEL|nr:UDP-23-diacylglucosamine hydrolase [Dissostichus eleginoides]
MGLTPERQTEGPSVSQEASKSRGQLSFHCLPGWTTSGLKERDYILHMFDAACIVAQTVHIVTPKGCYHCILNVKYDLYASCYTKHGLQSLLEQKSSRPAEQQPGSDGDGAKRSQPGQQRIYGAADRTGLWGKEHRKNYRLRSGFIWLLIQKSCARTEKATG